MQSARLLSLACLSFCALLPACAAATPLPLGSLDTEAEKSHFERTGRYEEVERLCRDFERATPDRARCISFGVTPEGRAMRAIVASADGTLDPAAAHEKRRPVILIQGGIHAGEIDGKDGGLWALRELLGGTIAPAALASVTVVFVPVFNVDGHERFRKNQRPNQRGPEETGFRTTAQNLNLNRDYMKAEAPEMQAMLGLFEAWDPVVYVDLHTTDGAKFQHEISVQVEPMQPASAPLGAAARALSTALMDGLKAGGHLPLSFYPSFRKNDDPSSGFSTEPPPPRLSQSYAAARNRLGILVETHSWATNERRIRAVHDGLKALFEHAARAAPSLRAAADAADVAGAHRGGAQVALSYRPTDASHTIEFLGFAYEKRPSEVSGTTWIVYDESRPEVWRVPLFDQLEPDFTVIAPAAGYVVPAAHASWVSAKLRVHGLRYEVLSEAVSAFPVEAFRAEEVTFGKPYEGRTRATVKGSFHAERRDLPRGSLFVPIDQPRSLLVLHLFEPLAPDSLVAWGFFNSAFERKEYMEGYVAEEEARKMMAADPALRAAFEARLLDPAFAANPEARLEFFYQRHPSWDERFNWVPVVRVASRPLVAPR